MIKITTTLSIPEEELEFTASRSSGPGGQNVNKLNTKVTLLFDVAKSQHLSDFQKAQIFNKLRTRINKDGILRIVSQANRTQAANRRATIEKFSELLAEALRRRKPRKKSGISAAQKKRRLEEKRRQSRLKRLRAKPGLEE